MEKISAKSIRNSTNSKIREIISNTYSISLLFILIVLITGMLYFLYVFADNFKFNQYFAAFLFLVVFIFGFVHGLLAYISSIFLILNLPQEHQIKTFLNFYMRSFSYPFKQSLRIYRTLFISLLIGMVLVVVGEALALNIGYNVSNAVKTFVDDLNALVKSGADTTTIYNFYYSTRGQPVAELLKYTDIVCTTIPLYYFVHQITRNTIPMYLNIELSAAPDGNRIPTNYVYALIKRLRKDNRKFYEKLYYGTNYIVILLFYVTNIISTIVVSFYSSSAMFIVGISFLISLFLALIVSPYLLNNVFRIVTGYCMPKLQGVQDELYAHELMLFMKNSGIDATRADELYKNFRIKRDQILSKFNDPKQDNEQISEELNALMRDFESKINKIVDSKNHNGFINNSDNEDDSLDDTNDQNPSETPTDKNNLSDYQEKRPEEDEPNNEGKDGSNSSNDDKNKNP